MSMPYHLPFLTVASQVKILVWTLYRIDHDAEKQIVAFGAKPNRHQDK